MRDDFDFKTLPFITIKDLTIGDFELICRGLKGLEKSVQDHDMLGEAMVKDLFNRIMDQQREVIQKIQDGMQKAFDNFMASTMELQAEAEAKRKEYEQRRT